VIGVFGASVTAQKTGYATRLASLFSESVRIFGYGGMHLSNAGICYIDRVLAVNPRLCFIDWFSTAYSEVSDRTLIYIDTLIEKFQRINCEVVFLFLPHAGVKSEFYRFCSEHLASRKVMQIDLRTSLADHPLEYYLRDGVHTNDIGSDLYSKIIFTEYTSKRDEIKRVIPLDPTPYENISSIAVNRSFLDGFALDGNGEIIGMEAEVGPHSGFVRVESDQNSETVNTWDRWCHYCRDHFILNRRITSRTVFTILPDHFDTSECKVRYDFSKVRKELRIRSIYFIGEELQIEALGKNLRFPTLMQRVRTLLTRVARKYLHLLRRWRIVR
jgi:hypothetical protein